MTTHEHGKKVLQDLQAPAKELRSRIPEVYAGYSAMHKAVLGPGALDTKTKELIALAIGVTDKCDGCIASHARGAARAGATADDGGPRPSGWPSSCAVVPQRSTARARWTPSWSSWSSAPGPGAFPEAPARPASGYC